MVVTVVAVVVVVGSNIVVVFKYWYLSYYSHDGLFGARSCFIVTGHQHFYNIAPAVAHVILDLLFNNNNDKYNNNNNNK